MDAFAGEDGIRIVQRTRLSGAAALARTLARRRTGDSEKSVATAWLAEMSSDSRLLPSGWYQPPPGGLSVLIGKADRFERLHYESLREPQVWPRDDIILSPESLIYVYASPTDRSTGLIGDLGATLYSGSSQVIRDYLSQCLNISVEVALHAEVGMELRELYHFAQRSISDAGSDLSNYVTSRTDAGASNIGHTVPWSDDNAATEGRQEVHNGDISVISGLIKEGRTFLNGSSRVRIPPTIAFTIEPRIVSPTLPLSSYHLIVTFLNGRKTICSGLGPVFEEFDMDRYLPTETLEHLDRP